MLGIHRWMEYRRKPEGALNGAVNGAVNGVMVYKPLKISEKTIWHPIQNGGGVMYLSD